MPSNLEILHRVGVALYGERYKPALADALGVDARRIRQWLSPPGSRSYRPVPPGVWDDLRALLAQRQEEIGALRDALPEPPAEG